VPINGGARPRMRSDIASGRPMQGGRC